MKIEATFAACLVLGTVLQFLVLPLVYFKTCMESKLHRIPEEDVVLSYEVAGSTGPGNWQVYDSEPASETNSSEAPIPFLQVHACPRTTLNKWNFLDLENCTMRQAERAIFGRVAARRVRQVAARAHALIPRLVNGTDWFNSSHGRLIESNLQQLKTELGNYTLSPGGHWRPNNCVPRWKVAIIIPFRNRSYHLPIFLRYLVPMLKRQQLEFGVFTVTQANDLEFNRAMLMNIGFVESLNVSHWDCFIFHDVDHVPQSDLNNYGCENMPRHFLTGDSSWNYTILYQEFFGAVTGFLESDMRKINGFPNVYWGWGGEDDEILLRVRKARLSVASRPRGDRRFVGFYKVIEHHHHSAPKIADRYVLLKNFSTRMDYDGLSNLRYPPPRVDIRPLYVNISVDIFKLKVKRIPRN